MHSEFLSYDWLTNRGRSRLCLPVREQVSELIRSNPNVDYCEKLVLCYAEVLLEVARSVNGKGTTATFHCSQITECLFGPQVCSTRSEWSRLH